MAGAGTQSSQAWKLRELPRLIESAEGFPGVVASLRAGHSATIDGAWGSSCALVAAALAVHVPATLVVVASHVADLEDLRDDIATFSGPSAPIFPPLDRLAREQRVTDEAYGERLRLLRLLSAPEPPRIVVTSIQALLEPVPAPAALAEQSRTIRVGETVPLDQIVGWLSEHGFVRRDAVELPGELSVRGGIVDAYPPDLPAPVRIELFGDEVESIRSFDIETQRSLEQLASLRLLAARPVEPAAAARSAGLVHLTACLPRGSWFLLIEPNDLVEQGRHYLKRLDDPRGSFTVEGNLEQVLRLPSIYLTAIGSSSLEATSHLRIESIERFSGELGRVKRELDDATALDEVLIACHNEAEAKRLAEVFADCEVARSGRLHLDIGHVRAGFRMVAAAPGAGWAEPAAPPGQADTPGDSGTPRRQPSAPSIVVLSDHELFHREEVRRPAPRRRYESRAIDSFLDLEVGDFVVHLAHGIGLYRGMELLEKRGQVEEQLVLEFQDGTRIYVPVSKIELVQKYVGGSRAAPTLSRIGSSSWERRKGKVAEAVADMAGELIELQAARASQPGIAYPEDSGWQANFEAAFPYEETEDQLRALGDIKADMARSRPMDRLICGDVGYGKTELAIRAAFKAVDYGKQVAVLVPTTVLAEQHFRTFTGRMAEFPFGIAVLSRFKTRAEQHEILRRLEAGGIDIVIGTHRLVQDDVRFHDLGLVIIDEEQRFGVEHKEKLKALRRTVEVLTLTATPIPRTLHLSLLGIRDISNLEIAPHDRLAIETRITRFDPALVRNAIVRELNRDGQVYFVHNRVHSIAAIADRLQQIVPEARILIGHGQMGEHDLEKTMLDFVEHRGDILVSTTIIESGLDIPNANTIFINDADRYGLADLHQLRGRVGRYKHRAYAYLLVDPNRSVTSGAIKRLKAIEEYSELGAGFKIAMRDLEIRGAGNILGAEQSGHIVSVGYELYCQLLDNAVRRLKKQPLESWLDVTIELPWRNYLPPSYVPGIRQKIEIYRGLSRLGDPAAVGEFRRELEDRFGPVPDPVANLLELAELRILAKRWQIDTIRLEGEFIRFGYRDRAAIERLARGSKHRVRIADAASAYAAVEKTGANRAGLARQIKAVLQ